MPEMLLKYPPKMIILVPIRSLVRPREYMSPCRILFFQAGRYLAAFELGKNGRRKISMIPAYDKIYPSWALAKDALEYTFETFPDGDIFSGPEIRTLLYNDRLSYHVPLCSMFSKDEDVNREIYRAISAVNLAPLAKDTETFVSCRTRIIEAINQFVEEAGGFYQDEDKYYPQSELRLSHDSDSPGGCGSQIPHPDGLGSEKTY